MFMQVPLTEKRDVKSKSKSYLVVLTQHQIAAPFFHCSRLIHIFCARCHSDGLVKWCDESYLQLNISEDTVTDF